MVVKKNGPSVVFSRRERWDLERVNLLLAKLSATSPLHHDLRILQFVKEHADADGFLEVDYKHARGSSFGRVYSGVGFQSCTKETRAFCSARFYVEDDLENAFPTIMAQVFKQAGLKTHFLDDYVARREDLFQELCTSSLNRDKLKNLFLVSLRGGNYRHHAGCRVPFLEQFQQELRTCTQLLLEVPEYSHIKAIAKNVLGHGHLLNLPARREKYHAGQDHLHRTFPKGRDRPL